MADSIFGKKNSIYFDWEACRVREGYYRIKPGTDYCIQRARAYAPHADLIWMETVSCEWFIAVLNLESFYCSTIHLHQSTYINLHYDRANLESQ